MSELSNYTNNNAPIQPFQIALYSNGTTQISRDQSKINANPFIFNHEVTPKYSITDQKSSGRCWLFATLNMLRIIAAQNFDVEPKELEFSQTYVIF